MKLSSHLLGFSLCALTAVATATPANATWSIVATDAATGEVCVATATCLGGTIQNAVPMVRVGIAAAATQSVVFGPDKITIWDGWTAGLTPQEILDMLGGNAAQFGIVDLMNAPVTFTGQNAAPATHQVKGKKGTLRYAIQGNVLAGKDVVNKARFALVNTPGDLSQRVMAAMEKAREFGGDGRCSCPNLAPNDCGSPPANFEKSAHTATIILARVGDSDGPCTPNGGCVQGDYYLNLDFPGNGPDPDPVLMLQSMYDTWRADLAGHPDHMLTRVSPSATLLPADGVTRATVRVELVDVDGNALTSGGATLQVTDESGSPLSGVGPITDHGDGSYSFQVQAGTTTGKTKLAIVADDGTVEARLYPDLELEVEPAAPLHVGARRVSAAGQISVPITIDVGAAHAGDRYVLFPTKSGTAPGIIAGGVPLPINPDAVTQASIASGGTPYLRSAQGVLDADGRAQATFVAPAGSAASLVGLRLDFAALALGATSTATNADGFGIVP